MSAYKKDRIYIALCYKDAILFSYYSFLLQQFIHLGCFIFLIQAQIGVFQVADV